MGLLPWDTISQSRSWFRFCRWQAAGSQALNSLRVGRVGDTWNNSELSIPHRQHLI